MWLWRLLGNKTRTLRIRVTWPLKTQNTAYRAPKRMGREISITFRCPHDTTGYLYHQYPYSFISFQVILLDLRYCFWGIYWKIYWLYPDWYHIKKRYKQKLLKELMERHNKVYAIVQNSLRSGHLSLKELIDKFKP